MKNFSYSYDINYASINDRFSLTYSPITRPVATWREEILRAVEDIQLAAQSRKIIVCMSGGVDGEIIARALLERGIPFSALTLQYTFDMQGQIFNLHDTDYARRFCEKYHLHQQVVTINWHDFIRHTIPSYIAQGYRAVMEHSYVQLYLLEKVTELGGCAIIGSGVQRYASEAGRIYTEKRPDYTLSIEWCERNNVIHFPLFFSQNPHLFAAYLSNDIMKVMLSDPAYYQNANVVQALEKVIIYGQAWPELTRRPKYEGFEQMNLLRIHYNARLKEQFIDIVPKRFYLSDIMTQLGI